jgi:IS30 family transposase
LIPNRVDIDQRPSIVAAKSRIGDWEADTIIGAKAQRRCHVACRAKIQIHQARQA